MKERGRNVYPPLALAIAVAAGFSVVAAACSIDAEYEGTSFSCEESERCPEGFTCAGGVCEPAGGERPDAGTNAGGEPDGGPEGDCGDSDREGALALGFVARDDVWAREASDRAEVELGGGDLEFSLAAEGADASAESVCTYDLRERRIAVALSDPPEEGEAAFAIETADGQTRAVFTVADGNLSLEFERGGSRAQIGLAYDEDAHGYWAFTARDGELALETSPDGADWSEESAHEIGEELGDAALAFRAGTEPDAGASSAQFSNLAAESAPE